MKTYEVTIKATVTKTITVQAETVPQAAEVALQAFSLECDGPENYEQDVIGLVEVDQ